MSNWINLVDDNSGVTLIVPVERNIECVVNPNSHGGEYCKDK